MKHETAEHSGFDVVDSALMMKVFYGFAVLAVLSVAISLGGRWFGHTIAMAGYTDEVAPREIVIGNDVISAPANMIRFEKARRAALPGASTFICAGLKWTATARRRARPSTISTVRSASSSSASNRA